MVVGSIVVMARIAAGSIFGLCLGTIFAVAMIGPACGYIIDYMSNVLHHYQIDEHVPA